MVEAHTTVLNCSRYVGVHLRTCFRYRLGMIFKVLIKPAGLHVPKLLIHVELSLVWVQTVVDIGSPDYGCFLV